MGFTSFLLVDDHEFILSGLKSMVEKSFCGSKIDTVTSAEEALNLYHKNSYEFVITDVSLPGKSGIELLSIIKELNSEQKVISLTQHTEVWIIKQLLKSNVNAIVLKQNEPTEIVKAIESINNGERYYTNIVNQIIVDELTQSKPKTTLADTQLTKREQQILVHIANELTTKEIASEMNLSEKTIEVHRRNLFVKLGVKNVVGLVKVALTQGLI